MTRWYPIAAKHVHSPVYPRLNQSIQGGYQPFHLLRAGMRHDGERATPTYRTTIPVGGPHVHGSAVSGHVLLRAHGSAASQLGTGMLRFEFSMPARCSICDASLTYKRTVRLTVAGYSVSTWTALQFDVWEQIPERSFTFNMLVGVITGIQTPGTVTLAIETAPIPEPGGWA